MDMGGIEIKVKRPVKEKVIHLEKFITNSSYLSCGITPDKKLLCSENRVEGKTSLIENAIPSKWPVKSVDAGRSFICAIFEGPNYDEVWCKGVGVSGQLGDGLSLTSQTLVKVLGLPERRFLDLGLANTSSCVVTIEKTVYCWGTGNLPTGTGVSATALLTSVTGVIELKGNFYSRCALKDDRTLWCWGTGTNGILGQGTTTNHSTPFKVKDSTGTSFLENISHFAVGDTQACAIVDEEVYCWGLSIRVGINSAGVTSLPHHIPELSGAVKIEAGDHHTCALLKEGDVYCWGLNRNFQIGNVEDKEVINPRKVILPREVSEIVDLSLGHGTNPSNARSCVLTKSGEVYCWGSAANGVFGNLEPLLARSFSMQPDSNVSSLKIGETQMCLIKDGHPYMTGFDEYNQVNNDRYIVYEPAQMSTDIATEFNCSRYSTCYVSESKLFCQGLESANTYEVTALGNTVADVIMTSHSFCGLMQNGDLKCWGRNGNGQIGNGNTTNVPRTTPFLTMQNVVLADGTSGNTFCALKTDKTVWCWGANDTGTIGHDNDLETNVLTPSLVVGLPDLTQVSKINLKVENRTACLQADDEIYCWGFHVGALLLQENANSFKAKKINALSGKIEHVAIINKGICVSYSDFTISCLVDGASDLSIFNNNSIYKKTFPALGEIKSLEGGSHLLCLILTNGRRYCAGNNSFGGMNHLGISPPLVLNPVKWLQ